MDFYEKAKMHKGCNTSFVTLIPKVTSPFLVTYYRPISLFGIQYKVIDRLVVVIGLIC